MMQSEPQAVRTFLANQQTVHANNPTQLGIVRSAQRQLRAVEIIYGEISNTLNRGRETNSPVDARPEKYAELHTEIRTLIGFLSSLGGRLAPTGKTNNPLDAIEMRWLKTGYPLQIELPATGQRIAINRPELVEIPDVGNLANLRRQGFIDRTILIGISPASVYWPSVGKIWQHVQSGPTVRTQTVQRQFRELLRVLGYNWTAKNEEADHVRDLQWGGQDAYANLWPLPGAANLAGNAILNQLVTYEDDAGVLQANVPLHTVPLNRYFRIIALR
jgi:hypothetical protein